jgi:hypothetical protein
LRPGPFKRGGKVLIGEDPPEDIGEYKPTPRTRRDKLALAGLSDTS